MNEIWGSLAAFLLADLLNPVLFASMVYAAGTSRPVLNSSAMLAGHTVAYLIVGIVLSFGLESIAERLTNPKHIDFFIEILVGLILFWVAWRSIGAEKKQPQTSESELSIPTAFGYGVIVNFIGIPFAIPYFAALSQILKIDPSFLEMLFILVVYNILYALPFAIVPALVAIMGEGSRSILRNINQALDRVSGIVMPIILTAAGLALIADATAFFWRGKSLF